MKQIFEFDAVEIDNEGNFIKIVDQTKLPNQLSFLNITKEEELVDAILHLKVRGAPALGIAAAAGICVVLNNLNISTVEGYIAGFMRLFDIIISVRPTAVNVRNGLERMKRKALEIRESCGNNLTLFKETLLAEAIAIKDEDIKANLRIAQFGLSLLKPKSTVLTYCNAGHLAVSKYGTALAPIYLAKERGMEIKVIACETRPLLQGARLTTYELQYAGVDVTLICDNMVADVMSRGEVDAIITGADRIAVNGDTANKIGTQTLAVVAKHFGIPHYIAAPSSTIDIRCKTGKDIVIEERAAKEITELHFKSRMAPKGIKPYNPAFDITPSSLITSIITENGIYSAPYDFKN